MRRLLTPLFILAAMLTACTSAKEIAYLQDIDSVQLNDITSRYEAKIQKDDLLSIIVSGPDKQVVMPYNLTLTDNTTTGGTYNPETSTLPYLVDNEGNINFPILGKIHVEGMTRTQLSQYLISEISKDVKDPIVYVSFKNFKITILGEVRNPGTYNISSEKLTIFQALGQAGDLTLSAKRDDILLIREIDGKNTYHRIDLRSASLLNDDYYYMQQNDVLIIQPSAKRITAATTNTVTWSVIVSAISSLLAILSFVLPKITPA